MRRGRPTGLVWYDRPREIPIVGYYKTRRRLIFWILAATLAYSALAPASGCSKYAGLATGYRALGLARDAGNTGTKSVAEWLRYVGKKCLEAHKSRSAPDYANCINPQRAKAQAWRAAMIGINVAMATALGALRAYHKHLDGKGGKPANWVTILRPVICGLSKAIQVLLPVVPKIARVEQILRLAEGVTCGS